jgi:hypothetical protein
VTLFVRFFSMDHRVKPGGDEGRALRLSSIHPTGFDQNCHDEFCKVYPVKPLR